MKKFEYITLVVSHYSDKEGFEAHINKLGHDGWEMVTAFDFTKYNVDNFLVGDAYTSGLILMFKREIETSVKSIGM